MRLVSLGLDHGALVYSGNKHMNRRGLTLLL